MIETNTLVRPQLRSPRAAGIAGIIFAILMVVSRFLIPPIALVSLVDEPSQDVVAAWIDAVSLVSVWLAPFAGVALLWFIGVVRDRLEDREDKFFATVFLSSGIIYVVLTFVWAGIAIALVGLRDLGPEAFVRSEVFLFGWLLMSALTENYILRMAGVFMMSIGSLWVRAQVMPRWLIIVTYLLGLALLLVAAQITWFRYAFPVWVFVVSLYVLITNRRLGGVA